jgi:hypothetical protein
VATTKTKTMMRCEEVIAETMMMTTRRRRRRRRLVLGLVMMLATGCVLLILQLRKRLATSRALRGAEFWRRKSRSARPTIIDEEEGGARAIWRDIERAKVRQWG